MGAGGKKTGTRKGAGEASGNGALHGLRRARGPLGAEGGEGRASGEQADGGKGDVAFHVFEKVILGSQKSGSRNSQAQEALGICGNIVRIRHGDAARGIGRAGA